MTTFVRPFSGSDAFPPTFRSKRRSEEAGRKRGWQMAGRALLSTAILALTACAGGPMPASQPHTLEGYSSRLPARDIETYVTTTAWKELRGMTFDGYVAMEGDVRSDGSVAIKRISDRFPDGTWDALATTLARDVRLKARSPDSHIAPKAEVYLIFYGGTLSSNTVVICGRQSGDARPGRHPALYLDIRPY